MTDQLGTPDSLALRPKGTGSGFIGERLQRSTVPTQPYEPPAWSQRLTIDYADITGRPSPSGGGGGGGRRGFDFPFRLQMPTPFGEMAPQQPQPGAFEQLVGSELGQTALTGLGALPGEREQFMNGIATAPVTMANWPTYGREGFLALLSSAFLDGGYQQQQAGMFGEDVPYTGPTDLAPHQQVIKGVIDAGKAAGDVAWAAFDGVANWNRTESARYKARAVRELFRSGAAGRPYNPLEVGFWDNVLSSLGIGAPSARYSMDELLQAATVNGWDPYQAAAEYWDMPLEVVAEIARNPDMTEDQLNDLVEGMPLSQDAMTNLIAEGGFQLLLLAGGIAAAGPVAGFAGGVARGGAATGASAFGTALRGGGIARGLGAGARATSSAGYLTRKALQLNALNTAAGWTTRGFEWGLKQYGGIVGDQGLVDLADRLLWEMPWSMNPGLNLIDGFTMHPIRHLRELRRGVLRAGDEGSFSDAGAIALRRQGDRDAWHRGWLMGPDNPYRRADGSYDVPKATATRTAENDIEIVVAGKRETLPKGSPAAVLVDRFASMTTEDMYDLLLSGLGWERKWVTEVFDSGKYGLDANDLRNALIYTYANIVRERGFSSIPSGPTLRERSRDFIRAEAPEIIDMLYTDMQGKSGHLAQSMKGQFWRLADLNDSQMAQIKSRFRDTYDPYVAFEGFRHWVAASKRMHEAYLKHAELGDLVATYARRLNPDYLRDFRASILMRYERGQKIDRTDINRLRQGAGPVEIVEKSLANPRKQWRREAFLNMLDRLDEAAARADDEAARTVRRADPNLPEDWQPGMDFAADARVLGIEPAHVRMIENARRLDEPPATVPPRAVLERLRVDEGVDPDSLALNPRQAWERVFEWYDRKLNDTLPAMVQIRDAVRELEGHVASKAAAGQFDETVASRVTEAADRIAAEIVNRPVKRPLNAKGDPPPGVSWASEDGMARWVEATNRAKVLANKVQSFLEDDMNALQTVDGGDLGRWATRAGDENRMRNVLNLLRFYRENPHEVLLDDAAKAVLDDATMHPYLKIEALASAQWPPSMSQGQRAIADVLSELDGDRLVREIVGETQPAGPEVDLRAALDDIVQRLDAHEQQRADLVDEMLAVDRAYDHVEGTLTQETRLVVDRRLAAEIETDRRITPLEQQQADPGGRAARQELANAEEDIIRLENRIAQATRRLEDVAGEEPQPYRPPEPEQLTGEEGAIQRTMDAGDVEESQRLNLEAEARGQEANTSDEFARLREEMRAQQAAEAGEAPAPAPEPARAVLGDVERQPGSTSKWGFRDSRGTWNGYATKKAAQEAHDAAAERGGYLTNREAEALMRGEELPARRVDEPDDVLPVEEPDEDELAGVVDEPGMTPKLPYPPEEQLKPTSLERRSWDSKRGLRDRNLAEMVARDLEDRGIDALEMDDPTLWAEISRVVSSPAYAEPAPGGGMGTLNAWEVFEATRDTRYAARMVRYARRAQAQEAIDTNAALAGEDAVLAEVRRRGQAQGEATKAGVDRAEPMVAEFRAWLKSKPGLRTSEPGMRQDYRTVKARKAKKVVPFVRDLAREGSYDDGRALLRGLLDEGYVDEADHDALMRILTRDEPAPDVAAPDATGTGPMFEQVPEARGVAEQATEEAIDHIIRNADRQRPVYGKVAKGDDPVRGTKLGTGTVPTRMRLMEAGDLINSWDDRFPRKRLQPRNIDTQESEQLVRDIAGNPVPERLLRAESDITEGAPAVSKEGWVEVGNHRSRGLKMAYEEGNADAYKAALRERAKEFGLTPEQVDAMDQPVLVRELPDEYVNAAYARAWNQGTGMSATSEAGSIGRNLDLDTMADLTRKGTLDDVLVSPEGASIIKRIMGEGGEAFAKKYIENGALNAQGLNVVKTAMVARIVGDERVASAIVATVGTERGAAPRLARGIVREAGSLMELTQKVGPDSDLALGDLLSRAHFLLRESEGKAPKVRGGEQIGFGAAEEATAEAVQRSRLFQQVQEGTATPEEAGFAAAVADMTNTEEVATFIRGYTEPVVSSADRAGTAQMFGEEMLGAGATRAQRLNIALGKVNELRTAKAVERAAKDEGGSVGMFATNVDDLEVREIPPIPDEDGIARSSFEGADGTASTSADAPAVGSVDDAIAARTADAENVVEHPPKARISEETGEPLPHYGERGAPVAGEAEASRLTLDDAAVVGQAGRTIDPDFSARTGLEVNEEALTTEMRDLADTGAEVLVRGDDEVATAAAQTHGNLPRTRSRGLTILNEKQFEQRRAAIQNEIERLRGFRDAAEERLKAARQAAKERGEQPQRELDLSDEALVLWQRYMRDDLGGDVSPPRTVGEVEDALRSLDYGFPPDDAAMTVAEQDQLRVLLRDFLDAKYDEWNVPRIPTERPSTRLRSKLGNDGPSGVTPTEHSLILEEMASELAHKVYKADDPLEGYSGVGYEFIPPPRKGTDGAPLTTRLFYETDLTDQLRLYDDAVPGLGTELQQGRMATMPTRVDAARSTEAARSLSAPRWLQAARSLWDTGFGARRQQTMNEQAIGRFIEDVLELTPEDLRRITVNPKLAADLEKQRRVMLGLVREWHKRMGEETMPLVGMRKYRRVGLLDPGRLERWTYEYLENAGDAGQQVLQKLRARQQAGVKTPVWDAWRRADNRIRAYFSERNGGAATWVDDIYESRMVRIGSEKAAGLTANYHIFRFLMDIRWLAMEFLEAPILLLAREGPEALMEAIQVARGKRKPELLFGTREAFDSTMSEWAWWASMAEIGGAAGTSRFMQFRNAAIFSQVQRAQQRGFPKELQRMALADERLAKMMRDAGDTPTEYLRRLDRDWRLLTTQQQRNIPEAELREIMQPFVDSGTVSKAELQEILDAGTWVSHPGLQQAVARANDPVTRTLLRRLEVMTNQAIDDASQLIFGQVDRSNVQRLMNHPLLYWPISYQIKATKWLAGLFLDRFMGVDTGAGPSVTLGMLWEQHRERLYADPDYHRMLEENKELFFFASMIVPITPWDIGVSMSPQTRLFLSFTGLADEDYRRNALSFGPIYTTHSLIPRLLEERTEAGGRFGPAAEGLQRFFPVQVPKAPRQGPPTDFPALANQ